MHLYCIPFALAAPVPAYSSEWCYPLLMCLGLLRMLTMLRSRIGIMTWRRLTRWCSRSSRMFSTGENYMTGSWMLLKHLSWVSTVLRSLKPALETLYHSCSLYLCTIPETSWSWSYLCWMPWKWIRWGSHWQYQPSTVYLWTHSSGGQEI